MTRLNHRTALSALAALALAGAIPNAAAAPHQDPPWLQTKTPSKKQLDIGRHQVLAEYALLQANDYATALTEFAAILKLDPGNERAALSIAEIQVRQNKLKPAQDAIAKFTKANPKSVNGWLAMSRIAQLGNDAKAQQAAIEHAVAADPASLSAAVAMFDFAYGRYKEGDATQKQVALESAQKLKRLARGFDYVLKNASRAVVELSGDPMDLTIYDAKQAYAAAFDRGDLGNLNKAMTKARAGFEECIKAQPQNEDCHYNLGMVYSSVKSSDAYAPDKALAEFAAAPTMPLAYVEAARIYRDKDDLDHARAALDKALTIDKRLAVAHVELGILDKLAGKTDAAVDHFVAAIDADSWGSIGDRALGELTKVKPTHPYVAQGLLAGKSGGDIFSSDKYQAVIPLIERELGGVEDNAPEKAVIEQIVQRLADASGVRQQFRVAVVATKMVNAMALADGRVYVTRGLLDLLKTKLPDRPIDANNDMLGHVLGHELQHVLRRHTLNSALFQAAIRENGAMDPSVVTSVTRLQEIDADRQGLVMAFLAGYHPRGGIEFMELLGKDHEIPSHLDHPTFQERVAYLSDYWTNDVRYAFVSFKLGVAAMDRGGKLETSDVKAAVAAYTEAVDDFKRYRGMLPNLKEAMNDLGIAYAKLGVLAMTATDTPLGRWQSRFSIERDSAVKWASLVRDDAKASERGATDKARLPWQLREAISQFKEALAVDEGYAKARLNLATAYVAANQLDNAKDALAKADAKGGVSVGEIELVRGIALAESKDLDKAKSAFDAAIKEPVVRRAGSYNLARALELAGKKDDAKRAYAQYSKLYPGGPWAKAADDAAAKL